jgi:hypothetical protein
MRLVIMCVAASVLSATTSQARAEIVVTEAEYAGGVLVVRGHAGQPDHRVTLDGRYSEKTDRSGQFLFRVRYLPDDCTIELADGKDALSTSVKGCVAAPVAVPEAPPPQR